MSVQVEKLEKNMAKLTIELSAEQFEDAMKKAFNKSKNKFNIPGFRKGKAPRAMIERCMAKAFSMRMPLMKPSTQPAWRQ